MIDKKIKIKANRYSDNYRIRLNNTDLFIPKEQIQELILCEAYRLDKQLENIKNDIKSIKDALKRTGIIID